MRFNIFFLLLCALWGAVSCSKYPPFEKNKCGDNELHGRVKTLKEIVYEYYYNEDGEVRKIDTLITTSHFNKQGFYTEIITPEGKKVFTYPEKGVIHAFYTPNDTTEEKATHYIRFYNEKGDLERVKNGNTGKVLNTYEYSYDSNDRATERVRYGIVGAVEKTVYQYDHIGNMKSKKNYESRLFSSEEWDFDSEWEYSYNENRHPATEKLYEGKDTLRHILTLRYEYTYDTQDNYTQRTIYAYYTKTNKELIYSVEKREIEYYKDSDK
ncbi:hypothetical protein [Capnocytophaga sp. oral taxon 878]|uniref:hypothetical protein n=1 Tax=Capnocytophaga sp. oral taxon 878 TaxID=1316596 RepID=UPI000D02B43B|nr:hypothetical protein [Capnocytophaga sp. oral taxon 878]AVM50466.1 hypothetical protein C4H12_08210 [Capnocytophaga sp. oral taxon 878]